MLIDIRQQYLATHTHEHTSKVVRSHKHLNMYVSNVFPKHKWRGFFSATRPEYRTRNNAANKEKKTVANECQ